MSKSGRVGTEALRSRIEAASASPGLVRVARHRLEERSTFSLGYLVGMGERFILLHHLDDGLSLDGYQALRIKHITHFETKFPRKAFYERALELKRESPQVPDGILLDTARELLRSIDERFPLLVIHREAIYPDECEVGRIRELRSKSYRLHWINPDATWEVDNRRFGYSDITRVEFAGRYENTLALVSGAKAGMVFPPSALESPPTFMQSTDQEI